MSRYAELGCVYGHGRMHMWTPIRQQGLGKTITALALVLKTKGMMPRVPRNALVIEYPPLVQADGTSTQRVAYVAPPEVEEDKRQQRTGLTPLIMYVNGGLHSC